MFPLTVTLHSLDQLVAVMGALKLAEPVTDPAPAPEVAKPAGKPSAAKTAPSPRTAEAAPSTPAPSADVPATSAPPSAPTTAPAAAAPSAPAVDYPTLQKAVAKLFSQDRARAAAIPSEFGKATYKDLTPDQWADALAKVEAAMMGNAGLTD